MQWTELAGMIAVSQGWRVAGSATDRLYVMQGKARHIIAGIAWVVGSLIAWGVVCNLFGFVVFMYLCNERQVRLPEWTTDVYNWTAVAGAVVIPSVVALLAMRSKLPWTGEHSPGLRGFPVEPSPPSDAA